jgi:hypothetical protein
LEIWGDESGNLDFDARTGSRHFIVCTMTTDDSEMGADLLTLRRDLDRRGFPLPDGFHATEDRQLVRDEVFALLSGRSVRVDVTCYRKDRVYERIRSDLDYFYKWAWFYHMKYVLPRIVPSGVEPFVTVATLGVRKKRQLHAEALRDVVRQCMRVIQPHCAHWSAASHPCLQAADYFTWAVARWKEGGDRRSYDLIKHQVASLYNLL